MCKAVTRQRLPRRSRLRVTTHPRTLAYRLPFIYACFQYAEGVTHRTLSKQEDSCLISGRMESSRGHHKAGARARAWTLGSGTFQTRICAKVKVDGVQNPHSVQSCPQDNFIRTSSLLNDHLNISRGFVLQMRIPQKLRTSQKTNQNPKDYVHPVILLLSVFFSRLQLHSFT